MFYLQSNSLPFVQNPTGQVEKNNTNEDNDDSEEADKEKEDSNDNDTKKEETADKEEEEVTYSLDDMTPDMVHYGSVPESVLVEEVENVRRIAQSELAGSHDAETLRNMTKVCNNGKYFHLY